MEEGNNLAGHGIWRSHVTALIAVTEYTGERQITERSRTSVFAGDDVIELIAHVAIFFMDQTVLTPPSGPTAYLLPYPC
jgi:hypothetical protein